MRKGLTCSTFKTSHPLQAPYTFAIHAIAEHFGIGASHTLKLGPARMAATKGRRARSQTFRAAETNGAIRQTESRKVPLNLKK